jgi:putative hydrolase of the HAD superfamily
MTDRTDKRSCGFVVFDADDTLWESALYFERAEEDFLILMRALGMDTTGVRQMVHRRDLERLALTGYGARPYLGTLHAVLEELCPDRPAWADRAFEEIGRSLLAHPVILLPGALEALEWIVRSGLPAIVYTMGETDHQTDKFKRSGLDRLLPECVVVDRKTPAELRKLLDDRGIDPGSCLVVGNSPRSDVNPALEIGASAVLCARERLWQAEEQEILDASRVHHIESLAELPGLIEGLR